MSRLWWWICGTTVSRLLREWQLQLWYNLQTSHRLVHRLAKLSHWLQCCTSDQLFLFFFNYLFHVSCCLNIEEVDSALLWVRSVNVCECVNVQVNAESIPSVFIFFTKGSVVLDGTWVGSKVMLCTGKKLHSLCTCKLLHCSSSYMGDPDISTGSYSNFSPWIQPTSLPVTPLLTHQPFLCLSLYPAYPL